MNEYIRNSLAGPKTGGKDSRLKYLARILTSSLLDTHMPQIPCACISNTFKGTKLHIQTFMQS